MNEFHLVAEIVEREALRYTPAGIPIVAARLAHRSEQIEARVPRLIELDVAAIAAGEVSGKFNQAALGTAYRFTGFLARKNRSSKSLVFHITDFETHSPDH